MSGVMGRIREAAARASKGVLAGDRERPSFPRVAAQSPFPVNATGEQFLARFREELEVLSGKLYGPFDAEGVARQVIELVRAADGATGRRGDGENPEPGTLPTALTPTLSQGEREHSEPSTQHTALSAQHPVPDTSIRVLSWDEAEVGCPGLGDRLRQASIEMVSGAVPNDENHQKVLEGLAALGVGLSGAVAGLADTGSIAVASGPGRARVASLLPPVHVAVLPISRLYPTLQDWLSDGGPELARRTANLVIITGPSRTSDIEMQLTLGMHGPKELHVVLYRD